VNIALSTLFLFIFLLPGIFFRRFYYTEQFSREYLKQNLWEVFLSTLIPSILLQTLWYFIIQTFRYKIDLTILGDLVSKSPSSNTFRNIEGNSFNIVFYHTTLLIFSSLLGHYSQFFIRKHHLDRRYGLFRFKNDWHYIFTGQFFDFPRATYDLIEDTPEEIDYVFIDALVQTKEGTLIYEGMLVDYELSDKLGLEAITLKEARRRYLQDDFSNKGKKHYNIPGHVIILKYSDIINLNFSYFKLDVTEENKLLPVLIK